LAFSNRKRVALYIFIKPQFLQDIAGKEIQKQIAKWAKAVAANDSTNIMFLYAISF